MKSLFETTGWIRIKQFFNPKQKYVTSVSPIVSYGSTFRASSNDVKTTVYKFFVGYTLPGGSEKTKIETGVGLSGLEKLKKKIKKYDRLYDHSRAGQR